MRKIYKLRNLGYLLSREMIKKTNYDEVYKNPNFLKSICSSIEEGFEKERKIIEILNNVIQNLKSISSGKEPTLVKISLLGVP